METFENTVTIRRPADEVFAFLADFENVPRWNYAIEKTKKASPGPVGVGTTYRQTRSIPGRSEEGFEVTVFEPGQRLAVRGQIGPFRARISYLLEAAAGGTRLTNDVALDPSPGAQAGCSTGNLKGQGCRGGEPQQAEGNPGSP